MRSERFHMAAAQLCGWLLLAATSIPAVQASGQTPAPIPMPSAQSMMGWGRTTFILFDELELVPAEAGKPVSFEALGWYGGATRRLWFRSEGEQNTMGGGGRGEFEFLYGRLISPYWDAVAGARYDKRWDEHRDGRLLFALGIIGEAPLRFEFSPTLFVSTEGDVSARLDASYQLLFTQRIVLEPSLDLNVAFSSVPEFGVGTGLNETVLAARLRYEITRKFGPYVGLAWARSLGESADFARAEGRDASGLNVVFGIRVWR